MKKNPFLIGFLIATSITLFTIFIYLLFLEKKDFYLIDNPTKNKLELTIDNQKYSVAPNQTTELKLNKGVHQVKYKLNNQTIDTTFTVNKAFGLLNPTKQDYYIFTRPYGYSRNVDSLFTSQTIIIDKKVYFGNIKKSNNIYIEDFYYNLNQDYPKVFYKNEKKSDLPKIFSKENFIQFYFENYE